MTVLGGGAFSYERGTPVVRVGGQDGNFDYSTTYRRCTAAELSAIDMSLHIGRFLHRLLEIKDTHHPRVLL